MVDKVRWKDVCEDFKRRHPTLAKKLIYYKPYNYATIELWFSDQTKMLYNYDTKIATFISKN